MEADDNHRRRRLREDGENHRREKKSEELQGNADLQKERERRQPDDEEKRCQVRHCPAHTGVSRRLNRCVVCCDVCNGDSCEGERVFLE